MLNHSDLIRARSSATGTARALTIPAPVFSDPLSGDWRVGSDPLRWDISFTVRLMAELKRLFRRKELLGQPGLLVNREIPPPSTGQASSFQPTELRKAA